MNFSRLAPLHFPPPVSSNNPYRLFHEIGQNYGYAYSSRRWIAKKIQKASIEKASFFSILALRPPCSSPTRSFTPLSIPAFEISLKDTIPTSRSGTRKNERFTNSHPWRDGSARKVASLLNLTKRFLFLFLYPPSTEQTWVCQLISPAILKSWPVEGRFIVRASFLFKTGTCTINAWTAPRRRFTSYERINTEPLPQRDLFHI